MDEATVRLDVLAQTSSAHSRMSGTPLTEEITNREFTEPVRVEPARVQPSLGLYQPCYPITEADYLRLKHANSALAGVGGAALSFAVSEGFPLIAKVMRGEITIESLTAIQIILPATALVVGGVLVIMSATLGSGKREVMKRIKQHFANNPGTMEIRAGDRP